MSVLQPFLESVARHPDRTAIVGAGGDTLSFAELDRQSSALAAAWMGARGLRPGRRILVAVPVSPALYVTLLAIWKTGGAAIFPEPFAGVAGVRNAVEVLRPDAVVAAGWLRRVLALARPLHGIPLCLDARDGGDGVGFRVTPDAALPALYSFTGGTTGKPKCIPRTGAFLLAQSHAVSSMLAGDGEVDLVWFPVFVLACLAVGSTAVLPDARLADPANPDVEALRRQVSGHGVTRLLAPPSVACALAASGERLFRTVLTGGGPVYPHQMDRLSGVAGEVVAVYGSTEAEPISVLPLSSISSTDMAAMRSGSGLLAGQPVEDLSLRLVEREIQVAGPHVVQGYLDPAHDAANKVREDGVVWHRTGDGGRLDRAGRLWLTGRIMGEVAGYRPFEVEAVALGWPGVTGAALAAREGEPVLVVAGNPPDGGSWRRLAAGSGLDMRLLQVARLPLDRRHASRVDYRALAEIVSRLPA